MLRLVRIQPFFFSVTNYDSDRYDFEPMDEIVRRVCDKMDKKVGNKIPVSEKPRRKLTWMETRYEEAIFGQWTAVREWVAKAEMKEMRRRRQKQLMLNLLSSKWEPRQLIVELYEPPAGQFLPLPGEAKRKERRAEGTKLVTFSGIENAWKCQGNGASIEEVKESNNNVEQEVQQRSAEADTLKETDDKCEGETNTEAETKPEWRKRPKRKPRRPHIADEENNARGQWPVYICWFACFFGIYCQYLAYKRSIITDALTSESEKATAVRISVSQDTETTPSEESKSLPPTQTESRPFPRQSTCIRFRGMRP